MIDVISNPSIFNGEIDLVQSLFEEGLDSFHLRKTDCSDEDLKFWLRSIDSSFYSRIVLHNCPELANEMGIEKQHVSNLKDEYVFSTSTHSIEELEGLTNVRQAFLSPVFDSVSKTGYKGKMWNVNDISTDVVKVALGGITRENINQAFDLGFDKVAVLGSIWMTNDPVKSFIELKNELR